jgi:hypothetical protein
MSGTGLADSVDDHAHHVPLAELRRAQCATERLEHRSDLLDYVHRLAQAIGEKPLQSLDVRPVAGLYGAFDVPFRDRRVFVEQSVCRKM